MSKLGHTFQRAKNASMGKGYKTSKEKKKVKAGKKQSRVDKVYANAQIPDEEEIARNERRKSAKRRGSRVSTIMTNDGDQLG